MTGYFFRRLSLFGLSMLLALSLVTLVSGAVAVGLGKTQQFVAAGVEKQQTAVLATVEAALQDAALLSDLPEDIWNGAINQENFSIISSVVARAFIFQTNTDFSNDTNLYQTLTTHLTVYYRTQGVNVSGETVSAQASFAVFAVNEALDAQDTAGIAVFSLIQSPYVMYGVIASAFLIVASVLGLDLINRGRHRKYSYIGMGLMTAGYVLSFVPAYIQWRKYVETYRFCAYFPYDNAVKICVNIWLCVLLAFGMVFFLSGLIMLVKNYRYMKSKFDMKASSVNHDEILENDARVLYNKKTAMKTKQRQTAQKSSPPHLPE